MFWRCAGKKRKLIALNIGSWEIMHSKGKYPLCQTDKNGLEVLFFIFWIILICVYIRGRVVEDKI